jgi:hypothetical protein
MMSTALPPLRGVQYCPCWVGSVLSGRRVGALVWCVCVCERVCIGDEGREVYEEECLFCVQGSGL